MQVASLSDIEEDTELTESVPDYPPPESLVADSGVKEKEQTISTKERLSQLASEPNMAGSSTEEEGDDSVSLYEMYWAQNTTAHGVSRVANTSKFHRLVWILALLGCFIYVSYEIYNSVALYRLFLTTTEINKVNKPEIEFPAVTFCNFNRWRKSHMTEEAQEQLKGVISLYSYDYVIPDLDTNEPEEIVIPGLEKTTKPAKQVVTTEPPPIECALPNSPPSLQYQVQGDLASQSTVYVDTAIKYECVEAGLELTDGDEVHTCTESGKFQGRLPLCMNLETVGERYTLANNKSNDEVIAVSTPVQNSYHSQLIENMTLCFWLWTSKSSRLGTILSYGVEGETILSVIQAKQANRDNVYGVKYKLFGQESRTITLSSFDEWSPFCLQYTQVQGTSKVYKFVAFDHKINEFTDYGDDTSVTYRKFPLGGHFVLFNNFESFVNIQAGKDVSSPSSGGQIANVNLWARAIPVDVMNRMLWHGNVYTMSEQTISSVMGSIDNATVIYDVAVSSQPRSMGDKIRNTGTIFLRKGESSISSSSPRVSVSTEASTIPQQGVTLGVTVSGTGSHLTSTGSTNDTTYTYNNTVEQEYNNTSYGYNATSNATTTTTTTTTTEKVTTTETTFNYADFTRRAGWQLADDKSGHDQGERKTLLSCTYRGRKCDSRWFTHRFGAYGNCYTFNQNIPQQLADDEGFSLPLIQDSSGPTGGLNLLLDIQTFEYAESTALNGNSELGLKFIVHAPYEVPVINSMGYAVGPGQKAFVGFDKTIVTNLPEPWGKCNKTRRLRFNENYTTDGCAVECRLQKVVEMCNCKPYYYPGDYDICTFSELEECAFIEIAKVNADFSEICDCPIACESEEYGVKLSYTQYPNQPYGRQLGEDLNISLPRVSKGVPSYDNTYQYIKSNVINLDLYFESMSEVKMKQNKAMDNTALLSNIGGQLGLFIGCSFLTAFEFLECIIMSTIIHCKRSGRRRRQQKRKSVHQLEMGGATYIQPSIDLTNANINNNSNGSFEMDSRNFPLVY